MGGHTEGAGLWGPPFSPKIAWLPPKNRGALGWGERGGPNGKFRGGGVSKGRGHRGRACGGRPGFSNGVPNFMAGGWCGGGTGKRGGEDRPREKKGPVRFFVFYERVTVFGAGGTGGWGGGGGDRAGARGGWAWGGGGNKVSLLPGGGKRQTPPPNHLFGGGKNPFSKKTAPWGASAAFPGRGGEGFGGQVNGGNWLRGRGGIIFPGTKNTGGGPAGPKRAFKGGGRWGGGALGTHGGGAVFRGPPGATPRPFSGWPEPIIRGLFLAAPGGGRRRATLHLAKNASANLAAGANAGRGTRSGPQLASRPYRGAKKNKAFRDNKAGGIPSGGPRGRFRGGGGGGPGPAPKTRKGGQGVVRQKLTGAAGGEFPSSLLAGWGQKENPPFFGKKEEVPGEKRTFRGGGGGRGGERGCHGKPQNRFGGGPFAWQGTVPEFFSAGKRGGGFSPLTNPGGSGGGTPVCLGVPRLFSVGAKARPGHDRGGTGLSL